MKKEKIKLYCLGFFTCLVISSNNFLLSKESYSSVLISSLITNLLWSFGVTKIQDTDNKEKIIYSIFGALGSLLGLFISSKISKL